MKMYFSRTAAEPIPPILLRKLKNALARGRICRDDNSQVAAFSTKRGSWAATDCFPPVFISSVFQGFSTYSVNSL
jgi:hypothetical protein